MTLDANHYLSWVDVDNELHCEQIFPSQKVIVVGRSDQADVEIFNTSVSRSHLKLTWSGDQLQVQDTNSSFGTWINGEKLEPLVPQSLVVDTEIKMGNLSMWYEVRRSDESQELFQTCFYPPESSQVSELSGEINDFRIKLLDILQDNFGDDTLNVQLIKHIDSELHQLIKVQELRLKEQRILNSISHILNRSLSSSDLLKTALNLVSKVMNADRGFVVLTDQDVNQCEVLAERHFEDLQWYSTAERRTYSHKLVKKCISQNKILIIGDSELNETLDDLLPVERGGGRSIVAIPLAQDGVVIGVIYLDSHQLSHHFNQQQIPFLTTFAAHTSIALHNTMLYRRAITDDLTGLYTRQYIDEQLSNATIKAKQEHKPLSLMILDLDHFKNINDSHGHTTGDEVLTTFASLLRELVDDNGEVGRFGGEEFIAILPDVMLDDAYLLAEKIRSKLEGMTIVKDDLRLKVTVSVGVAAYDDHLEGNALLLLEKADNAMYTAKDRGRNRTVKAL